MRDAKKDISALCIYAAIKLRVHMSL